MSETVVDWNQLFDDMFEKEPKTNPVEQYVRERQGEVYFRSNPAREAWGRAFSDVEDSCGWKNHPVIQAMLKRGEEINKENHMILYRYLGDRTWETLTVSLNTDGKDVFIESLIETPGKKDRTYKSLVTPTKMKSAKDRGLTSFRSKVRNYIRDGWSRERVSFRPEKAMSFSNYQDSKDLVEFPCYASFKMDGCKLTARASSTAFTKGGKTKDIPFSIYALIENFIERQGKTQEEIEENLRTMAFEGEVYSHSITHEEIKSHFAMGSIANMFYVYDVVCRGDKTFEERLEILEELKKFQAQNKFRGFEVVTWRKLESQEELDQMFQKALDNRYEGLVIANPKGKRVQGVSRDLFKRKPVYHDDVQVVELVNDADSSGPLVSFMCDFRGQRFKVVPNWSKERRRSVWEHRDTFDYSKKLTIEHRGLTAKGIPKHARGITLRRDYE